jgi:hypothetical protein
MGFFSSLTALIDDAPQREVEQWMFITGYMNYLYGTCINLNHFLALKRLCICVCLLYLGICCVVLLLLACHQNVDVLNFIYWLIWFESMNRIL